MERGEPPGRNLLDAEQSDDTLSSKPVKLNVAFNFVEAETGIVSGRSKGILYRPLEDALHDATVRVVERGKDERPMNKTIGLFQGVTATRVNGHVRYVGAVSVSQELFEEVSSKVRAGIESLQTRFKGRLEDVTVTSDPPLETIATPGRDAAVELDHEAPAGDREQGKGDRDGLGAEHARA